MPNDQHYKKAMELILQKATDATSLQEFLQFKQRYADRELEGDEARIFEGVSPALFREGRIEKFFTHRQIISEMLSGDADANAVLTAIGHL